MILHYTGKEKKRFCVGPMLTVKPGQKLEVPKQISEPMAHSLVRKDPKIWHLIEDKKSKSK